MSEALHVSSLKGQRSHLKDVSSKLVPLTGPWTARPGHDLGHVIRVCHIMLWLPFQFVLTLTRNADFPEVAICLTVCYSAACPLVHMFGVLCCMWWEDMWDTCGFGRRSDALGTSLEVGEATFLEFQVHCPPPLFSHPVLSRTS